MKARIIDKTIKNKVTDWLTSLPIEVVEKIKGKVVVTGGCIASMFLKEPVSDYDMYFKDIKSAIIISQYYCNKWIEEKNSGNSKVSSPLLPCLRLTFESGVDGLQYFSEKAYIQSQELNTYVVEPDCKDIESFLESKCNWGKCERVEIFIKSAGFVGENPDEEYDYFEGRESGSAEDYISKTLMDENQINKEDKGKYNIIFMSSNAITLSDKTQLVIRFFGEPSEIHDTYDFIHATNYWTSKTGLVTNTKALEALLAKELVYAGSKYPLASIFRTRKFIKREWSCHVGNYIKMALQLNEMNLNDPFVLEEQLTGVDAAYMYEIIRAVKEKKKNDPYFEFNSTYICTLVDRMMGVTDQENEDIEEDLI